MRKYDKLNWEINMFLDKHPHGCTKPCYCAHPAQDCGCADCQKRHAYRTYFSPMLKKLQDYRLN